MSDGPIKTELELEQAEQEIESLRAEISNLKKVLAEKEKEIEILKHSFNGRSGRLTGEK